MRILALVHGKDSLEAFELPYKHVDIRYVKPYAEAQKAKWFAS